MQLMSNAMSTKLPIDPKPLSFGILLYLFSNFGILLPWLTYLYGFEHRFSRSLRKSLDVRVHVTEEHHARVVTMMSILVAYDVDV